MTVERDHRGIPLLTEEQHEIPANRVDELPSLPDGYTYRKNLFDRWAILRIDDVGKPHLDPSSETYWSM